MSETITIAAMPRTRVGKGAARSERRAGRVPAVIYGDKKPPLPISLDPKVLNKEINRPGFFGHLFDIEIDGATHRALPRDVQHDPVTDVPLHVDFLRVSAATQIDVSVPVHFINEEESPGIKRGGVLNVVRHEVELVCRADSIPESLEIDLTGLEIGDGVHISAVSLPEGVKPAITDRDFTIATIAAPTIQTDEGPTEGEEGAAGEGDEGEEGDEEAES
ncbi:MAG: 50S ribosomal protein L25/general stress protein Ctc [Alphaproteobacteria bacterium]|nr:50S ribosomal protein L25/general stress protein Ctc [Alphaproteobacteria bacterium]